MLGGVRLAHARAVLQITDGLVGSGDDGLALAQPVDHLEVLVPRNADLDRAEGCLLIPDHEHAFDLFAPLSGQHESDLPAYADDPDGERIPLNAHIRLANPRDERTKDKVLVRRGMSYSRGMDRAGLLDQGLAFVSYQRRLAHFLATQERLKGEPLEEYTLPVGGGFFFALPGVTSDDGWLGEGLLA